MAYADYTYYNTTFCGSKIPQSVYSRFSEKATLYIDNLTMGRITAVTNEIKICCCEIAEVYYSDNIRGNVASENNDGYSVSYTQKDTDNEVLNIAVTYLSGTGLMYRGI